MVAMVQRLDARGFFFHPQLSVSTFLALVRKVFRNRFCCHGQSVAELAASKLSNFGQSLTINGPIFLRDWLWSSWFNALTLPTWLFVCLPSTCDLESPGLSLAWGRIVSTNGGTSR
jgi:hypothetical protein